MLQLAKETGNSRDSATSRQEQRGAILHNIPGVLYPPDHPVRLVSSSQAMEIFKVGTELLWVQFLL